AAAREAERAPACARHLSGCLADLARLYGEVGTPAGRVQQLPEEQIRLSADAGSFNVHTYGLPLTGALMPDGDVYEEELASEAGDDGPDMAWLTFNDTPARQRPAGRVYRFRALPAEAELLRLERTAKRAARDADPAVSEPLYYIQDAEILGCRTTASFGDVPGSYHRVAPPAGMKWVLAQSATGETQKDDEITPCVGDALWSESALHGLSAGVIVPMELVPTSSIARATGGEDDDARLLCALTHTRGGRRHRELREPVSQTHQETLDDFPLSGERSYQRLCEYIIELGGSPDGRQTKWMSESSCTTDSAAARLHDLPGLSIELAQTYDRADGSNLACMKLAGRTYQLAGETRGLAKYTTEQPKKETDIQKQRRKCLNLLGGYTTPQCTPERLSDDVHGLYRPSDGGARWSYEPHLVSWPNLGNEPGWLADRFGPRDRCSLLDLDHALVLPPQSFDAVVEEDGGPTLYMGPLLERGRTLYVEFAKSGISRGVFVPGKTRVEDVGVFFVAKKDSRIIMFLDCRRSNQRFQPSPPVSLFSAAGFTDLEAPPGTSLYFAGVDVQNAFYQHKLPAYLRPPFCLPAVTAGELGISKLDGRRAAPWTRLYPQLAVAPMGWNWALYFVQRAHDRQQACAYRRGE
ncbi:unnamed protein product, partial [Prorocentrum cordatum]